MAQMIKQVFTTRMRLRASVGLTVIGTCFGGCVGLFPITDGDGSGPQGTGTGGPEVASEVVTGLDTDTSEESSTSTTGGLPELDGQLLLDYDCIAIDRVEAPTVVPPAGLRLGFRVLDCNGDPIDALQASNVTVTNDATGLPFGAGKEGGSVSNLALPSTYQLSSVLALDLSDSVIRSGALDTMIDGALRYLTEVESGSGAAVSHEVAVMVFGRPDARRVVVEFTKDLDAVRAALQDLRSAESLGSTDLYGAYMSGLELLDTSRDCGIELAERFFVMMTDGTHEAGDEAAMREKALAALGARPDYHVYTIGIEGNYDSTRLAELASTGENFVQVARAEQVRLAFMQVAKRVDAVAHSNYVVGVCTPISLGDEGRLSIQIAVDGSDETRPSDVVQMSYPLDGLNGDVAQCDAGLIATQSQGLLTGGAEGCDEDSGGVSETGTGGVESGEGDTTGSSTTGEGDTTGSSTTGEGDTTGSSSTGEEGTEDESGTGGKVECQPWTRLVGTSNPEVAGGAAVDTDGNVLLVGHRFRDSAGASPDGYMDVAIAKVSPLGEILWSKLHTLDSEQWVEGAALDNLGNLYVTGWTNAAMDGQSSVGAEDIFVSKFDSTGEKIWTRMFGSVALDRGNAIAVAADNHVYVTGWYLWPSLEVNTAGAEGFVMKLSPDGDRQWEHRYEPGDTRWMRDVAVDPRSGDIYVGGQTASDKKPDHVAGTFSDAFVAKFSADGSPVWERAFGNRGRESVHGLQIDSLGNIYAGGAVGHEAFDGHTLGGFVDAFVAKYSPEGEQVWVSQFGSADHKDDQIKGPLIVDAHDNVYSLGETYGTFPEANVNGGTLDVFLAKHEPDGTLAWARQVGSESETFPGGMALGPGSEIYMFGSTRGAMDGQVGHGGLDNFLRRVCD